MYAAPALDFTNKQTDELNACWNSVIRRIFGYSRYESVKRVFLGLGRLNVKHLIMQRKVRFYKNLWFSKNRILHTVFIVPLMSNCNSDWSTNSALDFVMCQFEAYVNC